MPEISEAYVGQLMAVGFNFAPRGWAFCDGAVVSIAQNDALFSLLGTTYGGDGSTTFALPDLRGRASVHPGNGPGLTSLTWGQRGGAEQHSLTTTALPSGVGPATNARATAHSPTGTSTLGRGNRFVPGSTGGGQPVTHRDPYLGIHHCIALFGIYPSRN